MESSKTKYIRAITKIAIMVAIMCVISQISIPIGVIPITLQTFVVAFAGYFLGLKKSIVAIVVYISLGIVGAPVFSMLRGGFDVLIGYTGGFLWGFIPLVILCALLKDKKIGIPLGLLGVILCHTVGVIQYMIVSGNGIWQAILVSSLPFILKDFILVVLAYFLAERMRKIKAIN